MTVSLGDAITTMRMKQQIHPISLISMKQVVVIIPVKDNQKGIDALLESFFRYTQLNDYPRAIIIIDNNSQHKVECPSSYKMRSIPIEVIECKTPGPAAARNAGAKKADESYHPDWLFFTDSDCIFTETTFSKLKFPNPDSVGYQFNILANSDDWLSKFYDNHAILKPVSVIDGGINRPEALITAGALVLTKAFFHEQVNGFSEDFPDAAGEDLFLGISLRTVGTLSYFNEVIIKHDFIDDLRLGVTQEDMLSLVKRFYRYGKGNKVLQEKLLSDMDVHIDKAPNSSSALSIEAFNSFLAIYCNPKAKLLVANLEDEFMMKIIHRAMCLGYEGKPLFS